MRLPFPSAACFGITAAMTTFHLHPLNARHGITSVLAELRAAVRVGLARVASFADVPDFDLVVRAEAGAGVADWGVAGYAPAPGLIEMTLDPARFQPERIARTLIHELHHLMRWDGPGYGRSLGEALVSEGLAGHFVLQVMGGPPDPWDGVTPSAGVARRAGTEWARRDYDHGEWFRGTGGLRRWSGYGLGHRIVAAHLEASGGDPVSLAQTPAEAFRPALRRLIATDTPDADED